VVVAKRRQDVRVEQGMGKVTRRAFIREAAIAAGSATALGSGLLATGAVRAQPARPTLKVGMSVPLTTLDARNTDNIQGDAMIDIVYEHPIFRRFVGQQMVLIPQLAESWEHTDERTLRLKLRRGVQFVNGEELTAESVKWSLDTVYPKDSGAVRQYLYPSVEAVTVVDKYTVAIHTHTADRTLVNNLTQLPVFPAGLGKRLGKGLSTQSAGTGAYQVSEFVPGQRLEYKAYPKYWGPQPKLAGIDWVWMADDAARAAALLAGDVHIVNNLPVNQVARVRAMRTLEVREAVTLRIVYIGMRQDRGPLKDPRVRQAFNYAVDKQSIVRNVLQSHGRVANSPLAPAYLFANPAMKPWPYDPAQAKKLLSEAGYPSNFRLKFAAARGRFIGDVDTGTAVVGYLNEVGVQVDMETPEWGVLSAEVFGKGPQSKYDMFMASQGSEAMTEDSILRLRFGAPLAAQHLAYSNPEVDALLDRGLATLDDAKARPIYYEAQQKIWADCPWIWLHYVNTVFGVDRRVRGFQPRPDEYIVLQDTEIG